MSTANYYQARRQKLYDEVEAGYVLAAFDAMQQTNDSSAPFIQEANFYYLTGINEPGWMLVVGAEGEETLISPTISRIQRIFDGGITDEAAKAVSGIEKIVPKSEGKTLLDALFQKQTVGVLGPDPHEEYHSFVLNPAPRKLYEQVQKKAATIIDLRPLLARLRGRKGEEEVEMIRGAIKTTVDAFEYVKEHLSSASREYDLEAEFTYTFRKKGMTHAYEPIIASGANACTLHYQKNSAKLPQNGLILMDVGARHNAYAADITRTYAIGTPSQRERAVHAAVEKAHQHIIGLIEPGVSIKAYHEEVDKIMKSALEELELLKSPDDYRKYFPHAISHGLGIDVHDPLGAPNIFEPGMVLTVEPGIYIPEEGIGVRIEDDILVTETGHENLSADLPTSL